jgi:hypothetical protein
VTVFLSIILIEAAKLGKLWYNYPASIQVLQRHETYWRNFAQ